MPTLTASLHQAALDITGISLEADVTKTHQSSQTVNVSAWIDPATVTFVAGSDGLRHARLLVVLAAEVDAGSAAPVPKQALLNIGLEPADTRQFSSLAFTCGKASTECCRA